MALDHSMVIFKALVCGVVVTDCTSVSNLYLLSYNFTSIWILPFSPLMWIASLSSPHVFISQFIHPTFPSDMKYWFTADRHGWKDDIPKCGKFECMIRCDYLSAPFFLSVWQDLFFCCKVIHISPPNVLFIYSCLLGNNLSVSLELALPSAND